MPNANITIDTARDAVVQPYANNIPTTIAPRTEPIDENAMTVLTAVPASSRPTLAVAEAAGVEYANAQNNPTSQNSYRCCDERKC